MENVMVTTCRRDVATMLARVGRPCIPDRRYGAGHTCRIRGLALVEQGTVCDELNDWGGVAQMQWRHFNRPKDAYSLRVVRAWEVEEPRIVREAFAPGTAECGPCRNSLCRLIFRPLMYPDDHPRDWLVKGVGSAALRVGDIAARGHSHRMCVSSAGPIVDMTFAGI